MVVEVVLENAQQNTAQVASRTLYRSVNRSMSEVDEQTESALRENINRKGSNSYYYAHGNTANGPAWDGKEQPRLLAVETERVVVTKPFAMSFDSFSWLDETKHVRVYIDFPEAAEIVEENISLVTGDESLEFSVVHGTKHFCLNLSPLSNQIASASFKKKSDKFVITMRKASEVSWDKLKK